MTDVLDSPATSAPARTLLLTEDQETLRSALSEVLDREYSTTKVRATVTADQGPDMAAWQRLSGEFAIGSIALAAAGTAVLFPMILSVVSSRVDEANRGRATSTASTVAYLGFLLGPSYVGFWSDAVGLRGAMLAVACLGALLLLLTPLVTPGSRSAARAGRDRVAGRGAPSTRR